jgi:hypothetical protein
MITEAYLDSPLCLPLGLAKRGNMNIRSSKLRFRVTFVTFGCLPREKTDKAADDPVRIASAIQRAQG